MAYYRECPYCGLNIDPGERCTCRTEKREAAPRQRETASKRTIAKLIIARTERARKEGRYE